MTHVDVDKVAADLRDIPIPDRTDPAGDIAQFVWDSVGYTGVEVVEHTEPHWDGETYLVDASILYEPHHWRVRTARTWNGFDSQAEAMRYALEKEGVVEPVSCEDIEASWPQEMRRVHIHKYAELEQGH